MFKIIVSMYFLVLDVCIWNIALDGEYIFCLSVILYEVRENDFIKFVA